MSDDEEENRYREAKSVKTGQLASEQPWKAPPKSGHRPTDPRQALRRRRAHDDETA
jgi:hypothetical protein